MKTVTNEGKVVKRESDAARRRHAPSRKMTARSAAAGAVPSLARREGKKAVWSDPPSSRGTRTAGANANLLLECYEKGVFVLLELQEALFKWWEVDFAWCLPTDACRWAWGGCSGAAHLNMVITKAPRTFLSALLTRFEPLTYWGMVEADPSFEDTEPCTFVARASRCNALLPEDLRRRDPLFRYVALAYTPPLPAYQVVPGRTTLVIARVHADNGTSPPAVNWRDFPPMAFRVSGRRNKSRRRQGT